MTALNHVRNCTRIYRLTPRTLQIISDTLIQTAEPLNFILLGASGRALVALGDPSGVEVFERATQKATSPRVKPLLAQCEQQLKQKSQANTSKAPGR